MKAPEDYWQETPAEREKRILMQERNRAECVDDYMELVYTDDLDEVFAEMLRLHERVGDPRTEELLNRIFAERMSMRADASHDG